ncbi:MAG TPA: NUDIX domain-containing protein [Burkholderiaceae bacterium]|nr:NUDIX domain-containing protein [Burkholderiaceae bacterium]
MNLGGRLVFHVGGRAVGSLAPALHARMAAAFPSWLRGHTLHAPAEDAALAELALALRDWGVTGRWRNELLPVLDPADAPGTQRLARIERACMRPLGLLTQAVHLNGWAPDGRVWLQQRALDKATDPGLWDTLAGGLVSAREPDLSTALAREIHEEAGLQLADLHGLRATGHVRQSRPIDPTALGEGWLIEDLLAWDAVIPETLAPVNLDGEVAQFACLPWAEVLALQAAGQITVEAAWVLACSARQRGLPWVAQAETGVGATGGTADGVV